MYKDREHGSPM